MNDHAAERSAGRDSPGPAHAHRTADAKAISNPAAAPSAVLDSISDGVIALDNDWRLIYANPAVARLWGRDMAPLMGKPIEALLEVSPDNPFRLAYLTSKQSGKPISLSGYSEIFAGWIEVRGYPHPDGYTILFRSNPNERQPPRIVMESEREREVTRSINQRIFDTSLDLILVVDRKGKFLRVSPSAFNILGRTPKEMVGRNGTDFVHADDLEETRKNMRLARHGKLKRTFNCRYIHKDGHPVALTWTGLWSEPDEQYFFIGRDMTEQIVLETQLRQSQKMEAIGQLTGGIAHDFNNILTVILGMTEILATDIADDRNLSPLVAAIDEAATRGAHLTQRMLAFARKQPLEVRSLDLNEIITHSATLLRRTLRDDITVELALGDKLWTAVADASQIEDALLNLAVNARDAMPTGGKLVIETANASLDEHYADRNVEVRAGDYVSLSVSDTGIGMPPHVVERVFEPFFTTKEVGHGTGLGLSMVYGFVKQLRGHVKIYSEVGHGTRITLYLPRATPIESEATTPDPAAALVKISPPGHETILVVEDSASVRKVAVSILKTLGYRVLEAEDGPKALAVLEQPGKIDLLFTDLIMPNGIHGEALLERARALRPDLKALFTSGYSESFLKSRGGAEQGVPLLHKPYRAKNLAEAVRAVLDDVGVPA